MSALPEIVRRLASIRAALQPRKRRQTLIDVLARDLARDPRDAPVVCVEADVMADDMERYAPAAQEPARA